jgi:hypothetical protein
MGSCQKRGLPQLSSYSSAIERKNPGCNEDRDIPKYSFQSSKNQEENDNQIEFSLGLFLFKDLLASEMFTLDVLLICCFSLLISKLLY